MNLFRAVYLALLKVTASLDTVKKLLAIIRSPEIDYLLFSNHVTDLTYALDT